MEVKSFLLRKLTQHFIFIFIFIGVFNSIAWNWHKNRNWTYLHIYTSLYFLLLNIIHSSVFAIDNKKFKLTFCVNPSWQQINTRFHLKLATSILSLSTFVATTKLMKMKTNNREEFTIKMNEMFISTLKFKFLQFFCGFVLRRRESCIFILVTHVFSLAMNFCLMEPLGNFLDIFQLMLKNIGNLCVYILEGINKGCCHLFSTYLIFARWSLPVIYIFAFDVKMTSYVHVLEGFVSWIITSFSNNFNTNSTLLCQVSITFYPFPKHM